MITAAELTAMRAVHAASLPDSAQIQARTDTPDGGGGRTTTWATIATVACRIDPDAGGSREDQLAGRIATERGVVFHFPAGTVVTPKHRCIVGGRTYQLHTVQSPRSWELTVRATGAEVVT